MATQSPVESELHLEAMLYVLEDPSLDREAFEARLADDARLAEILTEAVEMLHSIRPRNGDSIMPVSFDIPSIRTFADSPSRSEISGSMPSSWLGLASLAASILLVGFLGWKSFQAMSPSIERDTDGSSVNGSVSKTAGDTESFKNVVWAWGEVGTGHHDESLTQFVSFVDNELALAACESVCESDVPEWLVMATAAILEQGGGIDSPLEDIDSRTLIQ